MDKIIFNGNVGKDPERKTLQSGTELIEFSVAVTSVNKGEKSTEWRKVTVFSQKLLEFVERNVKSGMGVLICGKPKPRAFKNKLEENVGTIDVVAENVDIVNWGKGGTDSEDKPPF